MVAEGAGGSIINVTSIEGVRAAPGYAAYAAAKAGVINFTKTAALELAPHGIRVNALAPDITMTEGMAAVAPPGAEAHFGLTVPMGRAGHVDEMAGAAVFLAGHCRATSPARPSTSTAGPRPRAAGTTTPTPAPTCSGPRLTRRAQPSSCRAPHVGRHAAVDGDHLSGDVAGLVRGQEDHQVGDVVGLAQERA